MSVYEDRGLAHRQIGCDVPVRAVSSLLITDELVRNVALVGRPRVLNPLLDGSCFGC